MTKKLLSLLVAALMVLALVPMGAAAKGEAAHRGGTRAAAVPTRDVDVDGSLLFENFDGDNLNNPNWWRYNADGNTATSGSYDFSNWVWMTYGEGSAYSGTDVFASFSYYNGSSWTQDNWLVTPDLTIPDTGYVFSVYVKAYSSSYRDKLSILVGEYGVAYDDESIDTTAWTEEIPLTQAPAAWTQWTVDLSAYAGKTIAIAMRHADTDMWAVLVDDVNVGLTGNPPPTPEPTPEPDLGDLVEGYYFEEGSNAEDFTFIDKDGDGFNWEWQEVLPETNQMTAYEGEGLIFSASYDNDTSTPLTPDNWAITPAVTLPNETAAFTVYAMGQDASYAEENFAFYCGETADPDQMTKVAGDFTATGEYVKYMADLTAFAGKTVYIAIRHYDVTDMFYLNIDQAEVWGTGSEEPPVITHTVTFVDGLTNEQIEQVVVIDGEAATAPDAPEHEGYHFTGWDVDFSNVTSDLTVMALYEINQYLVTFLDWDGSVIAKDYVNHGSAATAPADPEREGYTFIGWDTDFSNVTGDLTVTAMYEENEVPPTVLIGDVNCDGVVTASDISSLFAYVMNAGSLSEQALLNGDIDGNGEVNATDASLLAQMVFGA